MKNSKLRRALLLVASAVLLVCVSVGATLAYLTSKPTAVTNTFTVGKIFIELDETDENNSGESPVTDGTNHDGRDKKNEYHITPAAELPKDPVVWVREDSDKAFVFIKLKNELAEIEASNGTEEADKPTIVQQIWDNGWTSLAATKGIADDEMLFYRIFDPDDLAGIEQQVDDYKYPTFNTVYIKSSLNNTDIAAYADKTIVVTAYAIQYDGMGGDSAAGTAWERLVDQTN